MNFLSSSICWRACEIGERPYTIHNFVCSFNARFDRHVANLSIYLDTLFLHYNLTELATCCRVNVSTVCFSNCPKNIFNSKKFSGNVLAITAVLVVSLRNNKIAKASVLNLHRLNSEWDNFPLFVNRFIAVCIRLLDHSMP